MRWQLDAWWSLFYSLLQQLLRGWGGGGGGRGRIAHPNTGANLVRVEVVVHQAVDDIGQLGLDQWLTESLQGGVDGSQSFTELKIFQYLILSSQSQTSHPLNKVDYVVHGLVAGQPLVDVGDDVDANVAEQILGLFVGGLGESQQQQQREQFEHGEVWGEGSQQENWRPYRQPGFIKLRLYQSILS